VTQPFPAQEQQTTFRQPPPPLPTTPHELAHQLAQLARELQTAITTLLHDEPPHSTLHAQVAALRQTLQPTSPPITPPAFADMCAQTLVYGLFAARVAAPDSSTFTRANAAHHIPRPLPLLQELFAWVARPDLDERIAGLVDACIHVLQHAERALVMPDAGKTTPQANPILHFYETFLAAYDPQTRTLRGVYYTPEPVVSYIVRSVDYLLQTHLHKQMGLADEQTMMLDPATGTATFLHTVVQQIHATLHALGKADEWNQYVHTGLLPRLHGVELMMTPYTIAHLKLSMLLQQTGYTFAGNEQINIWLANALATDANGQPFPFSPGIPLVKSGQDLTQRRKDAKGRAGEWRMGNGEWGMPDSRTTGQRNAEPQSCRTLMVTSGQEPRIPRISRINAVVEPLRATALPPKTHVPSESQREEFEVRALPEENPVTFAPMAPVMVILGNPPYAGNSANKGLWEEAIRTDYYPRDSIKEQNPKLLLDDYVKFLHLGQWTIQQTGKGVLAFITNHAYLDNPTFRSMRRSLLHTFDTIYLLNLHGNTWKKETAPHGAKDENVFAIQQGVAIGIFVKTGAQQTACRVFYADLWGTREAAEATADGNHGKYAWLLAHTVETTPWQELTPQAPFFSFVPHNAEQFATYAQGWQVTAAFSQYASGIKTHRDHFVLAYEQPVLEQRITDFRNLAIADTTIQQQYHLPTSRTWNLAQRRQSLHADEHWREHFTPCLYRPFDKQVLYYHPDVIDRPRRDIMQHMLPGANIGLITVRQVAEDTFTHVLVTDCLVDCRVTLSNKGAGYLFPLYRYPAGGSMEAQQQRSPNLAPAFIHAIAQQLQLRFIPDGTGDLCRTIGPEDILHYLYAMLHSPTYRACYAGFLKQDFPRIPLTSDLDLFTTLAAYGATLVDLHLLRLPGSGGVGGAGGAALLRNPAAQGVTQHGVTTGTIEKVSYQEHHQRVMIGSGMFFAGVEPATWSMHIGGYQPLRKWLKDRKGRTLSDDDALHYMRMVVALRETQRLMAAIDALVSDTMFA
jgi:predicted helicase